MDVIQLARQLGRVIQEDERFLNLQFEADERFVGSFVDVKITGALQWALIGEMAT